MAGRLRYAGVAFTHALAPSFCGGALRGRARWLSHGERPLPRAHRRVRVPSRNHSHDHPEVPNLSQTTLVSVGVSYLVEQPPHCDLLRLSLSTGRFVRQGRTHLPGRRELSLGSEVRSLTVAGSLPHGPLVARVHRALGLRAVPASLPASVGRGAVPSEIESLFISPKFGFRPVALVSGRAGLAFPRPSDPFPCLHAWSDDVPAFVPASLPASVGRGAVHSETWSDDMLALLA